MGTCLLFSASKISWQDPPCICASRNICSCWDFPSAFASFCSSVWGSVPRSISSNTRSMGLGLALVCLALVYLQCIDTLYTMSICRSPSFLKSLVLVGPIFRFWEISTGNFAQVNVFFRVFGTNLFTLVGSTFGRHSSETLQAVCEAIVSTICTHILLRPISVHVRLCFTLWMLCTMIY